MSPRKATIVLLPLLMVALTAVAETNPPPVGAAVRFQSIELGPGWHRGFFSGLLTHPFCYDVITFEPRLSPDGASRLKERIWIAQLQRLQVTDEPGTALGRWEGLALPDVPEDSWQEVDLVPLLPKDGECPADPRPES